MLIKEMLLSSFLGKISASLSGLVFKRGLTGSSPEQQLAIRSILFC